MLRIIAIGFAALFVVASSGAQTNKQAASTMAADSAVIAAGAGALSGGKPIRAVAFEDAAARALSKAKFRDPSFVLHRFQIIARSPIPGRPKTVTLGASLHFVGSAGRRYRMMYIVDFTQSGRTLVIHRASVTPSYPPPPDIAPFFALVPTAKLRLDIFGPDATFASLAEFAQQNAVRLDRHGRKPLVPGGYDAFLFFPERLRDEEKIELRLSATGSAGAETPVRAWLLNQDGWRVAVGRIQIDAKRGAPRFLKAVIVSESKSGDRAERLAGVMRLRPASR